MKLAKEYVQYGENTILERSILSSVAFYYAQHRSVPAWFESIKSELFSMPNLHILFLYNDKESFISSLPEIKDKSVVSAIIKHEDFYKNYLHFFSKIAPELIGQKITCLKILKTKRPPASINKYINGLLGDNNQFPKRKLIEVEAHCASAIIFHDDKFLLLYSKKHKDFSFPQGHCEKGENLTQTITREIIEETGFIDFKIIKPMTSYGYRFYDNGKITHKIITCFLVKLISLKKTKKSLELHESYTNHFINTDNVMKKLNWAEDKKMMLRAKKLIGN